MRCTLNDIAREAGVSRSTVLRALSEKPDVSPDTRKRIRDLATTMKYRPNYIARSLTHGRTYMVGVITKPSIYYASHSVIEEVERGLRAGGYSTLLFISSGEVGEDEAVVEQVLKNQVEGVIAVPGSMTPRGAYHELVEAGVGFVILDGLIEDLPVPQITGNNYKAGRLSIEHLLQLGHRRIMYLGIPLVSGVGRERARGVQDAFREAGIPMDAEHFREIDFSEESAQRCGEELLRMNPRPTALLARHDVVARGLMRAIYEAGLRIPEDISVMGTGNIVGADMFRVPLTTVQSPADEMAGLCVRLLLDKLAGRIVEPRHIVLDVQIVIRASTGPPPA
jgi:LacI family transcriptional regulator